MDPQQRLLLELSYQAAHCAGAGQPAGHTPPRGLLAAMGEARAQACVVVGIASAEYNNHVLRRLGGPVSAYSATGGALSVASGRLAFTFGLRGPAVSVDTACSSSLVGGRPQLGCGLLGWCAVRQAPERSALTPAPAAVQVGTHFVATTMLGGCSRWGLTAGVGLILNPEPTAMFQKAGMLAPDGRCKALDAAADGYVRAEAAGVMLLQLVAAGQAAPAGCQALIRGTAVNQDGRSSSLTAPNGPAQQEVVRAALRGAGLGAGDVSNLQLHGTGAAGGCCRCCMPLPPPWRPAACPAAPPGTTTLTRLRRPASPRTPQAPAWVTPSRWAPPPPSSRRAAARPPGSSRWPPARQSRGLATPRPRPA